MRQVARKSLITVAAASGMLALTGGYAYANADAEGSSQNSPGVVSGNTVQVPVHVPVNLCGNTVNVVGVLNPAAGNSCAHAPGGGSGGGGSSSTGSSHNSPGVASGNSAQIPVDVPVNACGNNVTGVGGLNPAMGNSCAHDAGTPSTPPPSPGTPSPSTPPSPGTPSPSTPPSSGTQEPGNPDTPASPGTGPGSSVSPQHVTAPEGKDQLAETGSGTMLGVALPAGAAMVLGGALLYRRSRAASRV